MSPESFVYWLQGFVELTETSTINEKQWLVIKDHLKLVFDKQTPDRSKDVSLVNEIVLNDNDEFWKQWQEKYGNKLVQPVKLEDLYPSQQFTFTC